MDSDLVDRIKDKSEDKILFMKTKVFIDDIVNVAEVIYNYLALY